MAVVKRNNKIYVTYRPEGKYGPYKFIPMPPDVTEDEARQLSNELVASQKAKRKKESPLLNISGDTINELWEGYLSYIETYRKPRTRDDVEDTGNNLKRFMGEVSVASLTTAHIQLYIRQRKNDKGRYRDTKISNRTINKELAWLSGFLKWCRKNNIDAPKLEIEPLPYTRPIPVILTIQECMDLLYNLEPLYKAFVACLYLTGLRINEARMLKTGDVDYNNNVIYIRNTKSGNPKTVGIPQWLKELLQDTQNNDSEYVFKSKVTGGHIVDIRVALRNACAKAGITKHVTAHTLRHSIGAHLTDLDVSMRKIQELLGHSRISTTEWYTQVAMESKQKVAQTINALITGVKKL